jgi:hypothetical protein
MNGLVNGSVDRDSKAAVERAREAGFRFADDHGASDGTETSGTGEGDESAPDETGRTE